MKKKIIPIFSIFFVVSLFAYYTGGLRELESHIPNIYTTSDMDNDGISDIEDILVWARKEIKNKTRYHSAYYSGWYPPESEWVCSDVIWRSLQEMWFDLKKEIDTDIWNNIEKYPRVEGKIDSNIDFRRVPNLNVFFQRNYLNLTTDIIPENLENLKQWQAWDIVVFWKPKDHIAIISDKRNKNGVPYIIHNSAPYPREDDWLEYWNNEVSPIIGHYRIITDWTLQ